MASSIDQSTYKEDTLVLYPEDVSTLQFGNVVQPNHVVINNKTNQMVYISNKVSVSPDNHKLAIPAGGRKLFARETGFSELCVYYPGATRDKIEVESFQAEFDARSVSETQEVVSSVAMTGAVDINSLPALPAGVNNIGYVQIPELPGGNNTIGKVISSLEGVGLTDDRLNVDVGGASINIEQASLGNTTAKTATHYFHSDSDTTGEGTAFLGESYKNLSVEVSGTATDCTVLFYGRMSASGNKVPLQGVNVSTFNTGTRATETGQIWQLDITGLEEVICEISNISGGLVTVYGKAVA